MSFDGRLLSGIGVLAAVIEAGSFARAAEALGLTQSGVSRAVARLEARIGVRLFDRSPRAVTLTDEGRRFYAQVQPLLSGIEEAAIEVGGASAAVRGRLRVNLDPWFARLVIAPNLDRFLALYPDLTVELVARDRLGDLVAEGFDAAIRFGNPEPSSLIVRRLLDTRVVTVAAPSYLARRGRPLQPMDLATQGHECFLFRDSATGRPFDWEFHRQGQVLVVPVTGRVLVNDGHTQTAACLAGVGIAQLFEMGLEDELKSGALIDLFPAWGEERFPLYAYHPSRHLPPAKVRAFLDFVLGLVR